MKIRNTVRILLLDSEQRIFLMKFIVKKSFDPNKPHETSFWLTPGGKIEEGETHRQTIERELFEETGLRNATIVEPSVWYNEHVLFLEEIETLFKETYYIVCALDTRVSFDGLNPDEKESVSDHKWWSLEELKASKEIIFPKELVSLIEPIVKGNQIPESTITLQ